MLLQFTQDLHLLMIAHHQIENRCRRGRGGGGGGGGEVSVASTESGTE